MGRVTNALDAVVHFGAARIFLRENVNDSGPAATLQHARHLADHAPRFRHMVQSVARESEVERLIRERDVLRVAQCKRDVPGIRLTRRSLCHGEHRGRQIEPRNPADMPRERQCQGSRAAREVHGPIAFLRRDHFSQNFRFNGARLHHRIAKNLGGARKSIAYDCLLLVLVQICHSNLPR